MQPAILFDLDGTLLDTAYDLTMAVNDVVQSYHPKKQFSLEEARHIVGYGSETIFNELITEYVPHVSYEEFRNAFRQIYTHRKHQGTTFFEGVTELIETLNARKLVWAIVTNKTEDGAKQSSEDFPLLKTAHCIVGCDTANAPKPSSAPLLYACEELALLPEQCWFVGDTIIDMEAAYHAKIRSLAVGYGYGARDIEKGKYQPFAWIHSPLEILDYLK